MSTAAFWVWLLILMVVTPGQAVSGLDVVKVVVKEDNDVILPCSHRTKENIVATVFYWMKNDQKEVFFYDSGLHHNDGLPGQDEQFKRRVSHFEDELKNGNASIKILNTKHADSGNYTCIFPHFQPRQMFNIELIVGASSKPDITTLLSPRDKVLLQCEVRAAFPKPEVEWWDSTGQVSADGEPEVLNIKGHYYVYLNLTVTRTGRFYCVVTQEEIGHQVDAETFVVIREEPLNKVFIGLVVADAVLIVILIVELCINKGKHKCSNSAPRPNNTAATANRQTTAMMRWRRSKY